METPKTPAAHAAELLRGGPFARFLYGEAISLLGSWAQTVAHQWVVTSLTPRASVLGWIQLASGLPTVLLSLHGGKLADRVDRRRILFVTQTLFMGIAILIGTLVGLQKVQLWHLVAIGVLQGAVVGFDVPAAAALVPQLVGRERIAAALALHRSVFHGARTIGPAIGGFLIAYFGMVTAYMANAASYLALLGVLLTLPVILPGGVGESTTENRDIAEGLRFIRKDWPTLRMLCLMVMSTTFGSPWVLTVLPTYARRVLGANPSELGWMTSSCGVGAFIGSAILLAIASHRRRAWLTVGTCSSVTAVAALTQIRTLPAAALCFGALTFGLNLTFGIAQTIIQERAPDEIRGRVSSVSSLAFMGVFPFSAVAVSSFADAIGLRPALVIAAMLFGAGVAVVLWKEWEAERMREREDTS